MCIRDREGRQLQDKFLAGDGADDMVTAALTRPGVAAERAQGVAEGRIAVQREMSTVVEQLMAERRRADASERCPYPILVLRNASH